MLVVDPDVRLTAQQALKHQWIAKKEQLCKMPSVDKDTIEALCTFAQASQFRRACMSLMAWSLTNEERTKVRDAFIEMDQNHSGTIKLWELKNVLETQFHISDEQTNRVFQALDTANDHEIHYSEFLAAMCCARIALHDDLLKTTFHRFDTNRSGFITRENLQEVLGQTFAGAEVEEMLNEADLTQDGKISYEEFIQYLKSDGVDSKHVQAALGVIDTQLKNQPPLQKTISTRSAKFRARSRLFFNRLHVEIPGARRRGPLSGAGCTPRSRSFRGYRWRVVL